MIHHISYYHMIHAYMYICISYTMYMIIFKDIHKLKIDALQRANSKLVVYRASPRANGSKLIPGVWGVRDIIPRKRLRCIFFLFYDYVFYFFFRYLFICLGCHVSFASLVLFCFSLFRVGPCQTPQTPKTPPTPQKTLRQDN